jgi:hypothetical protein
MTLLVHFDENVTLIKSYSAKQLTGVMSLRHKLILFQPPIEETKMRYCVEHL